MTITNRWTVCLLGTAALAAATGCTSTTSGAAEMTGTWNGYVELLKFASGSDQVSFDITAVTGTAVTGTVLFGNGTLLPPPTSASEDYPAGGASLFDSGMANEVEGFRYTMMDADLTDGRLTLSLDLFQLWGGWCALQTPITSPHPPPTFWCGGADLMDQTQAQIDCQLICACTATACAPRDLSAAPISFDLTLIDGELVGSVVGLYGGQGEARDVVLQQP
jgi:hypothetical protein